MRRANRPTLENPGGYVGGFLGVIVVSCPLAYGVYKSVTDWPQGVFVLTTIVLLYWSMAILMKMHGSEVAR